MKHLRIYEDYSDEDIESLIKDLGEVGLNKVVSVRCKTSGSFPHRQTHPSWWTDFSEVFAIAEVPNKETNRKNEASALEKIKKGEFTQDLTADLGGMGGERGVSPAVLAVVSKENVQRVAEKSQTLDDLVSKITDEVVEVISSEWREGVQIWLDQLPDAEKEEKDEFFSKRWRSSQELIDEEIKKHLSRGISIEEIK